MDGWVIEFADFAKKLLHPARRLENMKGSHRLVCCGSPAMRDFARKKYTLTRNGAKLPVAHLKIQGASYNVHPLILLAVQMSRSQSHSIELEDAQRAVGITTGELAVDWLVTKRDALVEAVLSGGDTKPRKHFL